MGRKGAWKRQVAFGSHSCLRQQSVSIIPPVVSLHPVEVGGKGVEDASGGVGGRVGLAEGFDGLFYAEAVTVHEVGDYGGGATADGGLTFDEDGDAMGLAGFDVGDNPADDAGDQGVSSGRLMWRTSGGCWGV